MISAVARIMQPGVKADHMLILEGPQGAKKSSALKVLAGDDWFTDELAEIGSKDAAQQMRGIWIIEIAELDAISRAEVSRIKAFLTRTTDRYRPPYERYIVTVPRQCVFAGSVNPETYLRDETGNRRFWPVRCGTHRSRCACARSRSALGGGVARYRDGAIWWLDEPELIATRKAEQDRRYHTDAWDARIDRWLGFERRRVNHGYGNYDDWRDEEIERAEPARRMFLLAKCSKARWASSRPAGPRPIRCASERISRRGIGNDIRPERESFESGDIDRVTTLQVGFRPNSRHCPERGLASI